MLSAHTHQQLTDMSGPGNDSILEHKLGSIFMEAQRLARGGSHVGGFLSLKCALLVVLLRSLPVQKSAHKGVRRGSMKWEVHTDEATYCKAR